MLRGFLSHVVRSLPLALVGGLVVLAIDVVRGEVGSVVQEAVSFVFVVTVVALGFALYRLAIDESDGRFDGGP